MSKIDKYVDIAVKEGSIIFVNGTSRKKMNIQFKISQSLIEPLVESTVEQMDLHRLEISHYHPGFWPLRPHTLWINVFMRYLVEITNE